MFRKTIAAAIAATTIAGSAFAADLPARKVAPVIAPPLFTWTGFYIGLNAGAGFGGGDVTGFQPLVANAPATLQAEGGNWRMGNSRVGAVIGGQIGYNLQLSPKFVGGLEADIQWFRRNNTASANASYISPFWGVPSTAAVASTSSNSWFGTLRARLGVTPFNPNFMIYATGGLAYGRVGDSLSYFRTDNVTPQWIIIGARASTQTRVGWTGGLGVEWAGLFSPNLSLKAEWLYTDLGKSTRIDFQPVAIGPVGVFAITQNTTRHDFHTLRVGLNYRFGGWGAGPVVAKY